VLKQGVCDRFLIVALICAIFDCLQASLLPQLLLSR
jgi:hypothetical protein